jgi:hypothetical protein
MPRRRRRASERSASDADQVVRGGTRARHGGSNTGRLMNVGGALCVKRQLSQDYRPARSSRIKSKSSQREGPDAEFVRELLLERQACQAIEHFERHGDCGGLTALARAIQSDLRREKFIRWRIRHAAVRWKSATATFRRGEDGDRNTRPEPLILPRERPAGMQERRDVHLRAIAAVRHAVTSGDWRGIVVLVESALGRRHRERLLPWLKQFGAFRTVSARTVFSLRKGTTEEEVAIASKTRFSQTRTITGTGKVRGLGPKCSVCGRPPMSGEDICYHHQSE